MGHILAELKANFILIQLFDCQVSHIHVRNQSYLGISLKCNIT